MIFSANNLGIDNMSPVYEAYYGKPKEFIAIESELDKLIKNIKSYDMNKDIAKSDEVIAIERLFKKFFKLKDFYLNIYTNLNIYPEYTRLIVTDAKNNAFNYIKVFNIFRHKVSSKRVDSTNMVMGVSIDKEFIRNSDFNSEELMAVILHEIGHAMRVSLISLIVNITPNGFLSDILKDFTPSGIISELKKHFNVKTIYHILGIIIGDIRGQHLHKFRQDIEDKIIDKVPLIKSFLTVINSFMNIYNDISRLKTIKDIAKITESIINDPIKIYKQYSLKNIDQYAAEKYSDSFATSYGYGPALANALKKINMNKDSVISKTLYDIPVLNWWYDLIKLSTTVISGLMDEHPSDPSRVMAQLNKLKHDAKDPQLDPRVKKELELDIKNLEYIINDVYLDFQNDENKKAIFTTIYNNIAIKIFKGKTDIRELVSIFDIEE